MFCYQPRAGATLWADLEAAQQAWGTSVPGQAAGGPKSWVSQGTGAPKGRIPAWPPVVSPHSWRLKHSLRGLFL